MANVTLTKFKQQVFLGNVNFSAIDIGILLTYGCSFNQDNDEFVSDIVQFEVSGTGYSRQNLSNVVISADNVNHRMYLDADDIIWSLANFEADGAMLFIDTGTDSTSRLMSYIDFGILKRSQNTPFTIQWSDAEYIVNLR